MGTIYHTSRVIREKSMIVDRVPGPWISHGLFINLFILISSTFFRKILYRPRFYVFISIRHTPLSTFPTLILPSPLLY